MIKDEVKKNAPSGATSYAYIYGVVEYFKVENNKILIFEESNWMPFKNTTHESSIGTQFKPL